MIQLADRENSVIFEPKLILSINKKVEYRGNHPVPYDADAPPRPPGEYLYTSINVFGKGFSLYLFYDNDDRAQTDYDALLAARTT